MGFVNNFLISQGLVKAEKISVPVLSIGNLTFGGTGKTPVTHFLLTQLLKKGYKPGLVSRAYKAHASAPEKIQILGAKKAAYYGDEAFWLATEFPEVPVYVGQVKLEVAKFLTQKEHKKVNVVCVDDGFQHRQLSRDLDIVVLDATQDFSTYRYPPFGRAREGFGALERCHAIFITKGNLVSSATLQKLLSKLPSEKPVFEFEYHVRSIVNVSSGEVFDIQNVQGNVLAFCGLAMPESFFMNFEKPGVTQLTKQQFSDHYPYSKADAESLFQQNVQGKFDYVITSEKDAVKLASLWPEQGQLWTTKLELSLKQPLESLYGLFNSYLP